MNARPPLRHVVVFIGSYFGLVFGAGFLLGTLRVLFLVPQLGERRAELAEMPLMLAATLLVARWLVRRHTCPWNTGAYLAAGLTAMILVLAADIAVGMGPRRMSLSEVFLERDPVSGTAYYLALLVFGLAPWWFGQKRKSQRFP